MAVTLETRFDKILKDPKAAAVLEQHLPGISESALVVMMPGMTLKKLLSMPQGAEYGLTKEKADQIVAEMNASQIAAAGKDVVGIGIGHEFEIGSKSDTEEV